MENNSPGAKELSIFAIVAALACAVFYAPLWAAGMSVLEAVVNDISGYAYMYGPWAIGRREYLDGYFPLWIDISLQPAAAYLWASKYFTHLLLIFMPFDFDSVADIYFISRVWLMLFFGYLFARRALSCSVSGAAFAAVSFAFSGITQKSLNCYETDCTWLLPILLLALWEIVRKPRLGWTIACGFIGSILLCAGHPISAFYVFFMGALWVGYLFALDPQAIRRAVAPLAVSGVLCWFFSAPQSFQGMETFVQYWHYHSVKPLAGSLPTEGVFSLFLPWLVGVNKSNVGVNNLAPYLGTVTMLFFVFGVSSIKRKAGLFFFIVYAIAFTGLSYGAPPFSLLGYIPPLDRLLNSISAFPTISFAVAVTAGVALTRFETEPDAAKKIRIFVIGGVVAVVVAALYASWLVTRLMSDTATALFFEDPIAAFQAMRYQASFGVALFLGCAAIFSWRSERKKIAACCIVALAFFGLLMDSLGWSQENPGTIDKLRKSETATFIKKNLKPGMYYVDQCDFLGMNIYMIEGLRNLNMMSPLQPEKFVKLIAGMNGAFPQSNPADQQRFAEIIDKMFHFPFPPDRFGGPLSDLIGIQYMAVCELPLPANRKPAETLDAAVYKSDTALPGAFLTGKWETVSKDEALPRMLDMKRGEEKTALFVDSDPRVGIADLPPAFEDDAGTIAEISRKSQRLEFETDALKKSILVMHAIYMPGWKAYIDGKETKIMEADYLFRAIVVPQGRHRVVFGYIPPSFKISLWVFMTAVVFAAATLVFRRLNAILE